MTGDNAYPVNNFHIFRVLPAARLDRLEDVLVLMSQQELTPKKNEAGGNALAAAAGNAASAPANAQKPITPPAKPAATHAPAPSQPAAPGAAKPDAAAKPEAPPQY